MPFRELASSRSENQGDMSVTRDGKTESLEEQELLRRIGKMILAAHDVGDSHAVVISDHREVVDRAAIGAGDHEIFDVTIADPNLPPNQVVDDGLAFGNPETHRCLLAGIEP